MKKLLLLTLLVCAGFLIQTSLCPAGLQEETTDCLGYGQQSPSYKRVIDAGARVINFPKEKSFAVLWVPPEITQGRIVVLLHGSHGTPYEEIKDEIDLAKKYRYILLGVQWHDRATNRYYSVPQVYRIIDKALTYVQSQYNNDLSRIAFSGFSRGAAASYELAYFDLTHKKFFDLFIAHSGGIATDLVIAAGKNKNPDAFLSKLIRSELGDAPLKGSRFFLYSGDQDEEWGAKMSLYVENAKTQIIKAGGEVLEYVREPNGKHRGYRLNPDVHKLAMELFMRLTP